MKARKSLHWTLAFIIFAMSPISAEILTGTVTELGTGVPIPNATVTVVQLSSSTTSNASGQYAFGDLPGGTTYTVTAQAVGFITETKSIWIPGASNQAPSVTLTSPVNGSTYTAPATVNLAATATDPDGSIARVEFWTGTTLLNADTTSPYAFTWTNVAAGSYGLRAIAYDNAGATSTSSVSNITVNAASNNYALRYNGTNQLARFGNAIPALGRNFTVECCFYWEGGTEQWQAILERQEWGQQEWGIIIGGPGSGYTGQVSGAYTYDGNHNNAIYIDWSTPLATGTWHHVALVGNNTEIYLYVNGQRRATQSLTGNLGAVPSVQVSAASLSNPYEFFAGRIDEVRISNVARYTGNTYQFPLPAPFTPDANTLALWHFDEGSGTTTADASGNNHTGTTVNNPTWVSGYPFGGGTPPNQAPTVAMTSPVNGSTYTAPATISLAATASDPDGTIAAVRFYAGTTLLNLDTTSPYAYTWSNVSSGTYALYATATDNQGAVSTSAISNVTVYYVPPNQPPVVSLTSPVNGSTYTAPATISLAATASDPDGTIAAVRFYAGTTLLNLDTTSPYAYTWSNVSSGTYALYATATDNQGAVSTSAISNVTVYYVPPNQPPVVSLTSPVNNSTYTAPANITISATASDPDGSVSSVRFYNGTTMLNLDNTSPWTYLWMNVSSGTYQLRAVAQDNQGTTSTSTIVTVTVLSSSTPAVWYTLTTTANPTQGGSVIPVGGSYLAGSQIQVTAIPNTNYVFDSWSGDATGTDPIITITMDSDKSVTANFTYVPPANSSPTVAITSPADGTTYAAPATITISATASDSDGNVVVVRFYSGTTLLNTDSTSPYSYTWTGVAAGNYFLTAHAQDNQGAVGVSAVVGVTVSAQPVNYTLSATANPPQGGSIGLNPAGGTYPAGTIVTVTATPNPGYVFAGWSGDASGTNPTITLMMDSNKTIIAQFTPVAANVTLSVTANPPSAGTIILNPSGGSYPPGTVVTVTATPAQGYLFSGWTGSLVSTANPITVTVNANMSLVANFTVAPSTATTPDVLPGTVKIVGGLDGYVNTGFENRLSVFFQTRRSEKVYVRVFALNGRMVREGIVNAIPGTVTSYHWDLKNNDGTVVSAGVYIVQVKGGGLDVKKKIVVVN